MSNHTIGFRIVLSVLLGLLSAVGHHAVAQGLPACSPAEDKLWQRAQDTLGLFVVDDRRHIGGAASIVKFDEKDVARLLNPLVAGYHPASGYKEMACGKLDKWSLYVLGDRERDLHPHIRLADSFKYLIRDMPLGSEPEDFCEDCLWGEVTVPPEFEWFWNEDAPTRQLKSKTNKCGAGEPACVGQTAKITKDAKVCIYGPWIMEKAHRFWPEIHPVQAFWGQTESHTSLYVVDDNSQRFQQKGHYALHFLSPTNAIPWGTRFSGTLYQLVRIHPVDGATLTWRSRGEQGVSRPPITTGAGQIALTAPSWIDASLASACTTRDNRTQAILQAELGFDERQRWRALDISGNGTGFTYGSGPAKKTATSETKSENERPWGATTRVGWENKRQLSTVMTGSLAAAAAYWDVGPPTAPPALRTNWLGVVRQQLDVRPEVIEGDRAALLKSLRSEWTVSVVDLNNPSSTPTGGFRVQLRHPKNIPTSVTGPATQVPSNSSDFSLTVIFDAAEIETGRYRLPNLKVSIKLRLSSQGTAFDHSIDVLSLVPDFVAEVSGYDLQVQQGKFPPKLSQVIVPWLAARGCRPMTQAIWSAELEGRAQADLKPVALWELLNQRLRSAGIVRQTVNLMLGDRTIDAAEFQQLLTALNAYRDACAADAPRP